MKTTKIKLMLATILLSALPVFSEDQSPSKSKDESQTTNGCGILETLHKFRDRKRIPSRNRLELIYENGMLTLESETVEGCFSLEIASEDTNVYEYIPGMEIGESVAISLDLGTYSVTASNPDGLEFAGEMIVY